MGTFWVIGHFQAGRSVWRLGAKKCLLYYKGRLGQGYLGQAGLVEPPGAFKAIEAFGGWRDIEGWGDSERTEGTEKS